MDWRIPREAEWLLAAAARLVPAERRAGWLREWTAEAWYARQSGAGRRDLLRFCLGALPDAVWQRFNRQDLWELTLHPGFCLGVFGVALLAVALGSHGFRNTRLMLGGLPYPDADRVVLISQRGLLMGGRMGVAPRQVEVWRERAQLFSALGSYEFDTAHRRALVTPGFFAALGVPIAAGAAPHRFWFLSRRVDRWVVQPWYQMAGPAGAVGRLKPGVTAAAATRELRLLAPSKFILLRVELIPLDARVREPLGRYVPAAAAFLALGLLLGWRRWDWFYPAKTLLVVLTLLTAALEFSGAASITETGGLSFWAEPFSFWGFLVACVVALWWALADQRLRCRQCRRRLVAPARIGESGRSFLEPSGTELMCIREHGALYVPEAHSAEGEEARWFHIA